MKARTKTIGTPRLLWLLVLGLGLALGLLWVIMPRSAVEAQAVNPGFTVDLFHDRVWGEVGPGGVYGAAQEMTTIDDSNSRTVVEEWDTYVYASAVITDGGVFKMWYTGTDFYLDFGQSAITGLSPRVQISSKKSRNGAKISQKRIQGNFFRR